MAGNNDFLALYQELGLRADCSLEEFKLAHRKRVGALHPDRAGGGEAAMQELPRLNALYTRAMEFHRRHGRLPGAAQPAATTGPRVPPRAATPSMATPDAPAASRRNWLPLLLVLAAALVAAWLWTHPVEPASAPRGVPAAQPVRARAAPTRPAAAQTFELGTPAKRVRALQGAPLGGWEQHWDYGPSWVEFRCGVVTGWYSSPLRPLKVASPGPPASSDFVPPRNCKE